MPLKYSVASAIGKCALKDGNAIIVVCDGMADRPTSRHGFKTPLEAAETPNLNRLARNGSVGLMDPIGPGIRPGSDVAHFALLGYDPHVYYSGRGSLEAVGAGVQLNPEDVAFRANFATVDETLTIIDRRAGRIRDGAEQLAEALEDIKLENGRGIPVEFKHTVEHRGVLIFRGNEVSRMVSDTDPHATGVRILESRPLEESPKARLTAQALNEFTRKSFELLKDHPVNLERRKLGKMVANIVICRGAGTLPKLKPLTETYGVKAACVAAVAMVRGICKIAGMRLIDVEGATGGVNTNFKAKAEASLKALEVNDLVFLHIKAPDVAGHDGNFNAKKSIIEKIDGMVGQILRKIDPAKSYLAVTSDHTTPISVKDHTSDPVPLVIFGPDVARCGVTKFCERNAAKGNIGRIKGINLIPILMDYLGKSVKFGV